MTTQTIGPATAADVEHAIRNSGWAAYLYLGEASDPGWNNAKLIAASPDWPRLAVYRVKDLAAVDDWRHGVTTGGLVITDKGAFSTHVPRSETESLIRVILALSGILGGV